MKHPTPYLNDKGHLEEEGVALYVDALRSGDIAALPADILSHVEDCLECKKQVTGVYSFLMREDSKSQKEKISHPAVRNREVGGTAMAYRIAATIAAIVGIGVVGYTLYTNYFSQPKTTAENLRHPTSSRPAAGEDSTRVQHEVEFAAAYVPYGELEELVGNEVRSAGVAVSSPKNGSEAGSRIIFAWSGAEKNEANLSILDNRGEMVKRVRVKGGSYSYQNDLHPGLYYWKLDDGSNLLYVGKFLVRAGGAQP